MFQATHVFGPMAGHVNDVSMAAPRVPERVWYAPAPEGVPAPFTTAGMMLVGYEDPPERAWPGQVEYVLDRRRSSLRPHLDHEGMETGLAVYVLAGDP